MSFRVLIHPGIPGEIEPRALPQGLFFPPKKAILEFWEHILPYENLSVVGSLERFPQGNKIDTATCHVLWYLPPPVYKTPPQVTGFLYWSLIQDVRSHRFSLLESYTNPKVESYFGGPLYIYVVIKVESYFQVTEPLYWSLIQATPKSRDFSIGVLYKPQILESYTRGGG